MTINYNTIDNIQKKFKLINGVYLIENDDTSIDLNTECLNVVKIKMSNKTDFKFKLERPYEVNNDTRSLGVMLVGIKVEEDVIF